MSGSNYGGRQPNNTSYIKSFVSRSGSLPGDQWVVSQYNNINVLTPTTNLDLYIPSNIYLGGQIINTNTNENNSTNNVNTCSNSNIELLLKRIIKLETEIIQLKTIINKNDVFSNSNFNN
jgi:hypothetical protein